MNVDRPDAAKGDQSGQCFQREAQQKRGQVDQNQGVHRVDGMLAVRREPVQMLGAVMNGMKSPQPTDTVLQTVTQIDAQVAEQHDFDRLNKPILRRDQRAKVVWYGTVEPRSRS